MKFSDICKKIKSDEFTIDNCGHNCNDLKEHLLDYYNRHVEYANGAGDGKWNKSNDKNKVSDKEMREFYRRDLDRDYNIPKISERLDWISQFESFCFACGENVHFTFNGKGISANVVFDREAINKNIKHKWLRKGQFVIKNQCDYAKLPPLTVEIDISDKLVFANWFPDFQGDCPKEDEFTTPYSLNAVRGRINIAKWKAANQNIAYTQVGGCGRTAIWMNKERNKGYITSGYFGESDEFWNEEKKKYMLPSFLKGFEEVGNTDVSVWRVEMADSAKIDINKLKEKWDTEGTYTEAAIIKVPKGKWSLTSHYDVYHKLHKDILAEIKLK